MPVPDRVRWAVDLLDPGPAESVLEVGGGPGVSAALICARLTSGRLLAVDRSAMAVRRTVQRNAEHLAAGRLAVEQADLHALTVPGTFDAALTLDVNLFWTRDAGRELAVLHQALRPGGRLLVLYGATGPTSGTRVTDTVSTALAGHGFTDVEVVSGGGGFGVRGRRP